MRSQNDAYAIGVTRLIVGLSAAVQVAPINYQSRVDISLGIAGGTLFMHGSTLTAQGVSFGFPFVYTAGATPQAVSIYGAPSNLFLHAAGATCNVAVAYYLTQAP